MENINEMRKRHNEEIEELQKNCKHEVISDWIEQQFAPGHSTGNYVKICNFCGKIVKDKNRYEYKIIDGIGRFIEV